MCCLFTCCGWAVDLIQRCWTFTMSCCISSAVCCSLLTASMSGVALGYNYSLAEYIDLKETNVSVYMKRGIFDDEIADDMDWRRSGHQPVAGHIGEANLMTGPSDESSTLRSGRRLDDSIFQSNDRNNFEGSLMRLTAKAPDQSPFYETTSIASDEPLGEIIKPFQPGSIDQLKAVQSAINMRKASDAARRAGKNRQGIPPDESNMPHLAYPGPSGRRGMKFDVPPHRPPVTYNSFRQAVPDDQINDPTKWMLPELAKLPPEAVPKHIFGRHEYLNPTYPSPVTPGSGPLRPTPPRPLRRKTTTNTLPTRSPSPVPNLPKSIDEEMQLFKEKPLLNKFDVPDIREDEFLKKIKANSKTDEDYEEEIKGVPLRKRRSVDPSTSEKYINVNKTTEIKDLDTVSTKIQTSGIDKVLKLDKQKLRNVKQKDKGKIENIESSIEPEIGKEQRAILSSVLMPSKTPIIKLLIAGSVS